MQVEIGDVFSGNLVYILSDNAIMELNCVEKHYVCSQCGKAFKFISQLLILITKYIEFNYKDYSKISMLRKSYCDV